MRTTITLPEPLLDNAKSFARKRQITLSALIEDALRCRLSGKRPVRRVEFRLHTVRGKLVDPSLDLSRTSMILDAEDEERFRDANARR